MSVNAIAFGQIIEVTMPLDKENPTIWLITGLDGITVSKMLAENVIQEINVEDLVKDGEKLKPEDVKVNFKSKLTPMEQDILIIKLGLKGFRNFNFKDGTPVVFKSEKKNMLGTQYDCVCEEVIKTLSPNIRRFLSDIIWKESGMNEEEEKNSERQSGSDNGNSNVTNVTRDCPKA